LTNDEAFELSMDLASTHMELEDIASCLEVRPARRSFHRVVRFVER